MELHQATAAGEDPMTGPTLRAGRFESPLGEMVAVVDEVGALVYLDFDDKTGPVPAPGADQWQKHAIVWDDAAVAQVCRQIGEYFALGRQRFELPLAPIGNDFFQEVWQQLSRIPYGETISYGELARRVARPGAARAVGRANGSNPISIVIPCHRVIGADGKLTGYSGGIERKAALLALEQALTPLGQGTLPLGVEKGKERRVK